MMQHASRRLAGPLRRPISLITGSQMAMSSKRSWTENSAFLSPDLTDFWLGLSSTRGEHQQQHERKRLALEAAIKSVKKEHGADDAVVDLLLQVVQNGKLPDIVVSSSSHPTASRDSGPGATKTPSGPLNDDPKMLTVEQALETIQKVTSPQWFSLMQISGLFRPDHHLRIKNEHEAMIDLDAVRKLTGCDSLMVYQPKSKRPASILFNDNNMCEELDVIDALYEIKVIRVKPLSESLVKRYLKKPMDRFLSSGSDRYIDYTPGLVKTEPEEPDLDVATNDCSKAVVLVVAGESGSGKSRYSVGALAGKGGNQPALLRRSLSINDFARYKADTEQDKKHKEETDNKNEDDDNQTRSTLRELIELVTSELWTRELGKEPIYGALRRVANSLNKGRNDWAFETAKRMTEVAIENIGSEDITRWYNYEGKKARIQLDELVVVFDECGSSPDFVAGIIATARDRFLPFLRDEKGLAASVGLVLCGTGLEAVKSGTRGNRYLGSDPALTNVVTMRTTALDRLPDVQLCKAIEKGVFARVLAGNVRMLTQGLIPALTNELVVGYVDDEQSRLLRQCAYGSFRSAMEFCVRRYINLNALKSKSAEERSILLCRSFRFLMRSSLLALALEAESNHTVCGATIRLLEALSKHKGDNSDGNGDEDLFRMGLATRDPSKTSNALKYLACDEATDSLYSSDGYAFEIVLAAHLERYYAAVHGHDVAQIELKHAWPPAAEKSASLDEDDVKGRVKEIIEEGSNDVEEIVNCLRNMFESHDNKTVALVLRQGVPNVQGADVLVFVLKQMGNGIQLELSVFQAKNWASTRYASAMKEAALGIGIDAANNTIVPTTGSAGYSYQATYALGVEVAKRLKVTLETCDFVLMDRVISFAYRHSERSPTDTSSFEGLAADAQPELWSREMLEPTISALVVAPDSDESEANPEE